MDPTQDLVLQYDLKLASGHTCGGAYLKFLTADEEFTPAGLKVSRGAGEGARGGSKASPGRSGRLVDGESSSAALVVARQFALAAMPVACCLNLDAARPPPPARPLVGRHSLHCHVRR